MSLGERRGIVDLEQLRTSLDGNFINGLLVFIHSCEVEKWTNAQI